MCVIKVCTYFINCVSITLFRFSLRCVCVVCVCVCLRVCVCLIISVYVYVPCIQFVCACVSCVHTSHTKVHTTPQNHVCHCFVQILPVVGESGGHTFRIFRSIQVDVDLHRHPFAGAFALPVHELSASRRVIGKSIRFDRPKF